MTDEQAERAIKLLRSIDRGVTWAVVLLLLVLIATLVGLVRLRAATS